MKALCPASAFLLKPGTIVSKKREWSSDHRCKRYLFPRTKVVPKDEHRKA